MVEKLFLTVSSLLLLSLFSGCAVSRMSLPTVRISPEPVKQIDDRLFGGFMEMTSGEEQGPEAAVHPQTGRLRDNVVAAIRRVSPTVLRYPGGGKVEAPGFRWTQLIDGPDTTDPKDERKFSFGLHEFLDLCETEKIEPLLVVRFADQVRGILDPEETFQEAESMVAYVTARVDDPALPENLHRWPALRAANGRKEPWDIPLWQIGNEYTWVAALRVRKEGMSDTDQVAAYVNSVERTLAMIERLDPDAEIIVENNMEDTKVGLRVTGPLKAALGKRIDYLSTHQYYSWGIDQLLRDEEPVQRGEYSKTDYWRTVISAPGANKQGQALWNPEIIQITDSTGYPVALTEWNWNSWWQLPEEQKPDFVEPLWDKGVASISFLHGIIRAHAEVRIANQSMLLGTRWDLRAVDVSEGRAILHPSGALLGLYSRHHGSHLLHWESDSPLPGYSQPYTLGQLEPSKSVAIIDMLVTANPNGTVYLHLINRDPGNRLQVPVDLSRLSLPEGFQAKHIAVQPRPKASELRKQGKEVFRITEKKLPPPRDGILKISLPPRSVNVVILSHSAAP